MFVLWLTAALAAPSEPLKVGVPVRIVAVDAEDAFYEDRATLVGLSCAVGDQDLIPKDPPGWFGGRVACSNGRSYYFYKVQLSVESPPAAPVPAPAPAPAPEVVGRVDAPLAKKIAPTNGAPPTAPAASATAPAAVASRPTGPIAGGSKVRIVDVSPEDSYYDDRAPMIGVTCTLTEDQTDDDGWYSGAADSCSNGSSYYFYEAALEVVSKPVKGPKELR